MSKIFFSIIVLLFAVNVGGVWAQADSKGFVSPTEGVIDHRFVPEQQMMGDILDMMARFSPYLVKNYVKEEGKLTMLKENYGGFRSQETMFSTEDGIRSTSDLGMIAGFLYKYGKQNNIPLPENVTYDILYRMAMESLVFIYSSHRSNVLVRTRNSQFWGSLGSTEQFESSLWAMGMAYQAYFLWDSLSVKQRDLVFNVLRAESDYVLRCPIRCRFQSDTRAEENGWDVCVLAATIGLFPDCEYAPKYFERLRRLAINTLSYPGDAKDNTVIDPDIDSLTVRSAYVANNLFPDYTLQNHDRFHPGYQNVVVQELGEAALALALFQQKTIGHQIYRTNALMHNCKAMQDSVLHYLALPDGELAMPNGNDWSMFLFDQITSYSTMACFLRDPDALMLESQAFKNVRARQLTTGDGSWMLKPDVGARRMGVQGHRILMVYLMHLLNSTSRLKPSSWDDFHGRHIGASYYKSQMLLRASSPDRDVFFSLANNQDMSGYFVPNSADRCKIVIPMPNRYGTGNFLGWYNLNNNYTRAMQVNGPRVSLDSNGFCFCADYYVNSYYMSRRHALYCTPGNAVISLDMVRNCKGKHLITKELCGALAISFDPFTSTVRRLYHEGGCDVVSDTGYFCRPSGWINIDNTIGILNFNPGKMMYLDKAMLRSSINTRVLSTSYCPDTVEVANMDMVGKHAQVYLSNVSASETRYWQQQAYMLDDYLPHGWMGMVCSDARGSYVLIANLFGSYDYGMLSGFPIADGGYFPVLKSRLRISDGKVSSDIRLRSNSSLGFRVGFMISANNVEVVPQLDGSVRVLATDDTTVRMAYCDPATGKLVKARVMAIKKDASLTFVWTGKKIKSLQ